ncbi:MAG: hypothetical protein GF334_05685 [Candidatus Altiarchaeales archaeon]|nr:hypothetical protein [Candidatus Altiarchaeales archaeon]
MAKEILVFLLLIGLCSGFGPQTQKHICEQAVKQAWGKDTYLKCIPTEDVDFIQKLCSLSAEINGEETEQRCLTYMTKNTDTHPALIPYNVFRDQHLHYNFNTCPIDSGPQRMWICGEPGQGGALRTAENWFNAMSEAPDECTRVYELCIGGNYFADAQNPARQVLPQVISNDCVERIEDHVEEKIESGLEDWSRVRTKCEFEKGRGSTHKEDDQYLIVSRFSINAIIRELVDEAEEVKDKPYKRSAQVVVLANSLDHDLAVPFYRFLRDRGVSVEYCDANIFDAKKYDKNIIILGGHGAPEGVGSIASQVLSASQRKALEQEGAEGYWVRENLWSHGQKILVIAGYSKTDTRDAWMENKNNILNHLIQ